MIAQKQILTDRPKSAIEITELLYEKHAPGFLSMCIRYCGNIKDAEDVLQDGFIKIIKNLSNFKTRKDGSFEGWMKRIVMNTILNYIRDHAREKRFLDIEVFTDRLADQKEEETHFEELANKIDTDEVMNMICELPCGYRTVFNLYVFESYSHQEIAKELGFSESTSKSQLSKARALLRKRLDQAYFNQLAHDGKAESHCR